MISVANENQLVRSGFSTLSDSIFFASELSGEVRHKNLYPKFLLDLENFVLNSASSSEIPFVPYLRCNLTEYNGTRLAHDYFRSIQDFINTVGILSPQYFYSENVNIFVSCIHAMNLHNHKFHWGDVWRSSKQIVILNGQEVRLANVFNELVNRIRIQCNDKKIKSRIRDRKRDCDDRYKEYCNYVDALFRCHNRLVILQVDLGCKSELASSIDAEDCNRHMNRMIANMRGKSIFDYKVGYIAKLAYDLEKGFHFHFILFLDESKRRASNNIYFAQEIGEYWVESITKNVGDYWGCKARVGEFEQKYIRMTDTNVHAESDLLKSLKQRVWYLCKMDQYVRPQVDQSIKLIRRGLTPKISKKVKVQI